MILVSGEVVKGLQAAAKHTLPSQISHFEKVIPDLKGCYLGTINLKLEKAVRVENPDLETRCEWAGPPGELFGFLEVGLEFPFGSRPRRAWIYIPHCSPHYGNPFQVEVISEKVEGLGYGSRCQIHISRGTIELDTVVV